MLNYLEIYNTFFSDVYSNDISDMKCQLYHLNLEQYLIQQKHNQNFERLCQNYCVSTSFDIYLLWQDEYPSLNVILS